MRIVCPSCDAAYEVPEALLGGAARRLRCARCAHEWAPPATEAPPEPAVSEPPRPAPEPRAPQVDAPPPGRWPRSRPSPRIEALAALAISVVVLCGLAGAAYTWRGDLMRTWPPSIRVFAAFGLH